MSHHLRSMQFIKLKDEDENNHIIKAESKKVSVSRLKLNRPVTRGKESLGAKHFKSARFRKNEVVTSSLQMF